MKRTVLLLGAAVLAGTLAFAQDATTGSSSSSSQDQDTQTTTRSSATQDNVVRGCLSGSPGNYTITDRNGTQYTVNGDDATLRGSVGRQVEIRFTQNQSTDTSNQGATTTSTTHTIQASQVRSLSSTCSTDGSATPDSSMPNRTSPQGASDTTTQPQLMAMLQQQNKPEAGTQQQQQATPPVTNQTPATQASPNNSQVGTSPANNAGMTESEANHDAQAARQGELSTNPKTGEVSGRGVDNQGVNNPSTTAPNAVPTSPNSATPSSTAQPQANANDENKPLYERQATDIPWAHQSGNNGQTGNPPH